jgi:hypothetical protein
MIIVALQLALRRRGLLQREVGVQVDLSGLDRHVAKPERDHRTVDAGLEELHRRTVPKDVRRHPLAAEPGALLHRGLHMLGH